MMKWHVWPSPLKKPGFGPGDRVAGFMPNMPQTIIAMLAATSMGATWSSCSPDFGIKGVLDRFGQIKPKVLFTADGYSFKGKTIDSLGRIANIIERSALHRKSRCGPLYRTGSGYQHMSQRHPLQ